MLENLRQTLKIVLRALLSNKTRSILTMLGIVIGVAAVVLIMSLGSGAQTLILGQVDSFGADMIGILPGKSDSKGPPAAAFGLKTTSLKSSDAKAIKEGASVPYATYVSASYNTSVTAYFRDISYSTTLEGVNGDYFILSKTAISSGRFFSDDEIESNSALAVLGSEAAVELFSFNDPVGQKIKIKNRQLTVIGVLEEKGSSGFSNPDKNIFAPLDFVQKEIAGVNYLSAINVMIDSEDNIDESMVLIEGLLRERHGIDNLEDDDFSVRSFRDAIELITTITDAFRYFLAAMAAMSLLVGGVGIMNIMLVGVTERTREIGLRKALGARKGQIRQQFLLESVCLTLFAGLIGLVVGTLISYLISIIISSMGFDWAFIISIPYALLALSTSALIGIIFGYYPAKKASDLNPIAALRYE